MKMKKLAPAFLLLAGGMLFGLFHGSSSAPTMAKADPEITIKPFAEYRFQDAENLGKDTSGNGFDLLQIKTSAKEEAIQQLEEEGEKYLAIRHDAYGSGSLKDTGGAWLYAPELGNTNKDFTDLIDGSYTVSATIRSNYYFGEGNRYAINFGRYCSAIEMTPWAGGVEVAIANTDFYDPTCGVEIQSWLESSRKIIPISESNNNQWVTITLVGDASTGKIRAFLDGTFLAEYNSPNGTRLTNVKADEEASSYAFCIGGQCDVRGGSYDPLIGAVCDYKQVTIFDCKLSDANVKALYDGEEAIISKQDEDNREYVSEVQPIDSSAIDLEITDKNTVNGIIRDSLEGKKIKVKTASGGSRSYNAVWYPAMDGKTIKGKALVDDAINCENVQLSLTYKYVCKLDYDPNKVEVSDVTLDNKAYQFGDEITATRHTVSFLLTPKDGVTIEEVAFNEMEWDPEEDDEVPVGSYLYFISFTKGAHISVVTSGGAVAPSSEEPSTSGEEPAGSQGGQTPAPSPSSTPEAEEPKKGGCGSAVTFSILTLSSLTLLGAALVRGKRKE